MEADVGRREDVERIAQAAVERFARIQRGRQQRAGAPHAREGTLYAAR